MTIFFNEKYTQMKKNCVYLQLQKPIHLINGNKYSYNDYTLLIKNNLNYGNTICRVLENQDD